MSTQRRGLFQPSRMLFVGLAVLCGALSACGVSDASGPVDISVAIRAVHDYGKGRSATAVAANSRPTAPIPNAADSLNTDEGYKAYITGLFAQRDYAQLEKEISTARA